MRTKFLAAAATLLLFTAACGSDDSSNSSSDATTAEASGDTTAEAGGDASGSGDRAAQVDSIIATLATDGVDEACARKLLDTMADADIAIVAANADETLTDAGQLAMAAINECPRTGG